MRYPKQDLKIFKKRCEDLKGDLQKDSAGILLFSGREFVRNHDVHHPFRVESNFYYLTGFEEPQSIFLYRPGKEPERVLFVREKDPKMETWTGYRYGTERAKEVFEMDEVHDIKDFTTYAPRYLSELQSIYYTLYKEPGFDEKFQRALQSASSILGRSGRGQIDVRDPYPLLGERRLKKSPEEIELIRRACEISAEAHCELMKAVKPGLNEMSLQGLFTAEIMKRGAKREAYPSIVATGDNATTLHYEFNDCECRDGDLLLVDAGAEYYYYAGDITRTYPVNGHFLKHQARLYNKVLKIQKAAVESIRPGETLEAIGKKASLSLIELMLEEGLLKGNVEALYESGEFKKYYPHGIGHWLGMDVHDAGKYKIHNEPRPLEKGMVFTIEPGLYIPEHDVSAPNELRGIGIRIEDNILVTESGYENLTLRAPKEIEEIESLMKN